MLSNPRALSTGIPTKVCESLSATGTDQSRAFSRIKSPGSLGKVNCQAIGSFTVLNGTIDFTTDAGTTWQIFQNFDFVASPLIELLCGAGVSYRFNILNLTKTVSPDIWAVGA